MVEKVNVVKIILDGKNNIKGALKGAQSDIKNFSSGINKAKGNLKSFATTSAVTFGALTLATKSFLDAAAKQEQQITRLNSVLASTEGAAGRTSDEIQDLASSIQEYTTVGDEAILSGTNMLLTFTEIEGVNFDRTTKALVDMGVAINGADVSGEQLKTQAIQLGKALNAPVEGLAALSRVGVQFTESQKDAVKAMVEAGDTAGAQVIILEELEKQFGGAAAAAAGTFSGAMIQASNNIGDAKENAGFLLQIIGAPLAKAFNNAAKALKDFTGGAVELVKEAKLLQKQSEESGDGILSFSDAIAKAADGASKLSDGAKKFANFIKQLKEFKTNNPFIAEFAIGLAKVLAVAIPLGTALGVIGLVLAPFSALFSAGAAAVGLLGTAFTFLLSPIGLTIAALAAIGLLVATIFPDIGQTISETFSAAGEVFSEFLSFFTGENVTAAFEGFRDFFVSIFESLAPILEPIFALIKDIITTAISFIDTFVRPIIEGLVSFFAENFGIIKDVVLNAFDAIAGLISVPINIISGVIRAFLALIRGDFSGAFTAIKDGIVGAFNGIIQFAEGFIRTLAGVLSLGWAAIGDGVKAAFQIVKNVVFGVLENIANSFIDLINLIIKGLNLVPGIEIGNLEQFDFGGARADGGRISAGKAYLVGEEGPELIVPNSSGTVIPNDQLEGSGGGITINVTINGDVDSRGRVEQITDEIITALAGRARLNQFGL